jgi:excisionase family DNA binding protein
VEAGRDVCSTREAADRLGVSLRTVQLWSEAGLLRAWKTPGGHRRILTASVDELLQRREGVTGRQAPRGLYEVLVVEDQADFRQLFELHLRSWGLPIQLTSAPSGFEALLQMGASRPDLLELEIIVVTALTPHTISESGGLPDGVTVLYKPLQFADLRQRLSELVGQRPASAAG